MSDLKILHLSTATSWRGGEQQLVYLYKELNLIGITQLVLLPSGSALQNYCRFEKMSFETFKKKGFMALGLASTLAKLARANSYDLVACHDSHAHSAAVYASKFFGLQLPIVVHRKVDFPVGQNFISRAKYNHPSVKAFICVSEEVRRILGKTVRKAQSLHVVYDGIDLERFKEPGKKLRKELEIADDELLIGNVAALTHQKDHLSFIKSAEILLAAGQKMKFVILGDGELMPSLKHYIQGKVLEKEIYLLGFRQNIDELLPEMDLFLFSSRKEGLGTSVLDAFAAGVPVVCTDAGGLKNIIRHQENAYLGKVGDPESLAEGVEWMFSDEERKLKIVRQAEEDVQEFSYVKMAKGCLEVYQSIF